MFFLLVFPIWLPIFFLFFRDWTRIGYRNQSWHGFDNNHFHLVFWIRQDLKPQPLDRELSLPTTRPDLRHMGGQYSVTQTLFTNWSTAFCILKVRSHARLGYWKKCLNFVYIFAWNQFDTSKNLGKKAKFQVFGNNASCLITLNILIMKK